MSVIILLMTALYWIPSIVVIGSALVRLYRRAYVLKLNALLVIPLNWVLFPYLTIEYPDGFFSLGTLVWWSWWALLLWSIVGISDKDLRDSWRKSMDEKVERND